MPSEDTKALEFNKPQNSHKTPSTIYADLESFIETIDGWKNNHEKLSPTKVGEHIPSGIYYIFQWLQYHDLKTENNHDVYREKDSMKSIFWMLEKSCKEDN